MRNPFRRFEDEINCENHVESYFFWKIYDLYCASIEITGIPDTIPEWFIKDTLFFHSRGCMIYDDVVNEFAFMKLDLSGFPDIYNIPEDRNVFTSNGYLETYGKDNSVIFWDSFSGFPFCEKARMYANILATAWKTRELNLFNMRQPRIIVAPDKQKLTYEILSQQIENMIPVIRVNDTIDIDKIKVLDLESNYNIDKLEQEMRMIWCQILADLGYENNPIEKKERLVSNETNNNNGEIEGMRNSRIMLLKRSIEQCNKLWSWNATVRFNSSLPTQLNLGYEYGGGMNVNGDIESE